MAFLFEDRSLRRWPVGSRRALLDGGEMLADDQPPPDREWWVNFYHFLDPVSGALSNEFLCGQEPPANFHLRSGFIPGWAHVAYWEDLGALRFILGRTYGKVYLRDQEYRPWPRQVQVALSALGYVVWAAILLGGAYTIITWAPDLLSRSFASMRSLIGS